MVNDDIKDLIGRYATGSLTAEERKRLFDAALEDQDLFDELAREQDLKRLIDEPGARHRLIRALEPPKRRVPWMLGLIPVGALSALLLLFVMRPTPKPPSTVAVAVSPAPVAAPSEVAATEAPRNYSAPVPAPAKPKAAIGRSEPLRDQPRPEADKREAAKKDGETNVADQKEADQVAAATPAPAPPAARAMRAPANQLAGPQQQNSPGGPRQNVALEQASAKSASSGLLTEKPPFGFHYSLETKGHLIVIPGADGYLSVKTNDGAILYDFKRTAAGIIVDIALPNTARSVSIAFSPNASPVQSTPVLRTDPSGTVQGANLVIDLKLNP